MEFIKLFFKVLLGILLIITVIGSAIGLLFMVFYLAETYGKAWALLIIPLIALAITIFIKLDE